MQPDEIIKVDDQRLVFGWASIAKTADGKTLIDRQNDFIDDVDELEKSAYRYVLDCRDGGVMHLRTGVATVVESMMFTPEKIAKLGLPPGSLPTGWWVGFKVHDETVWDMVKKGSFTGFSVHGRGRRERTTVDMDGFTHIGKSDHKLYYFEDRNTGIAATSIEDARSKKKRGGDKLVGVRTPSESEKKQMRDGVWVRTRHDGKSPVESSVGHGRGQGPPIKKGEPDVGDVHIGTSMEDKTKKLRRKRIKLVADTYQEKE